MRLQRNLRRTAIHHATTSCSRTLTTKQNNFHIISDGNVKYTLFLIVTRLDLRVRKIGKLKLK